MRTYNNQQPLRAAVKA